MRDKIVAGNWKMHKNAEETEDLLNDLINKLPSDAAVHIIVAPTFVNLASAVQHLEYTNINVAAQNMHQSESGAFTGEISAGMLTSIGVTSVILGHSERRAYFNETAELLKNKVDTALKNDLVVIFCFGEELKDRQANTHFELVEKQLRKLISFRRKRLGKYHFSIRTRLGNWNGRNSFSRTSSRNACFYS